MFSARSEAPALDALSQAEARIRRRHDVLDLTVSDPAQVKLPLDWGAVAEAVSGATKRPCDADPFGDPRARLAVADYYSRRGVDLHESQIVLAPDAASALARVLRLVCDPGDGLLAPTPGAPRFTALARACNVRLDPYALVYEGRWRVDHTSLLTSLRDDTRAVFVSQPQRPSGLAPGAVDRRALLETARARGLAVVGLEPSLDYLDAPEHFARCSLAREAESLTLTVSHLAGVAGLSPLPIGWTVLNGPEALIDEARTRLTHFGELFGPAPGAMQGALPELLDQAEETQDFLRDRLLENLETLDAALEPVGLSSRERDGGWFAVVDLPVGADDEATALRALERSQVLVHPGRRFGITEPALVVSLLPPPPTFRAAVERLVGDIADPGASHH